MNPKTQTQRTNILYLTTDCNLDCTYCYEANKRNQEGFVHFELTEAQIDEYVEEIERTEGTVKSSTVVIMGGEPTMAHAQIEYVIEKMIQSAKKLNKGYYCTFTTNGIKLGNSAYYKKLMDLFQYANENGFTIIPEISYDGKYGQKNRVFPNGTDSTEIVKGVVHKLNKDGIKFDISAVVTDLNHDKLIEETIRFFETYKNSLNKLTYSFAHQELDTAFGLGYSRQIMKEYRPYMVQLFKKYNIPICPLTCGADACTRCEKGNFIGNRYLSPTLGILTKDQHTEEAFSQF